MIKFNKMEYREHPQKFQFRIHMYPLMEVSQMIKFNEMEYQEHPQKFQFRIPEVQLLLRLAPVQVGHQVRLAPVQVGPQNQQVRLQVALRRQRLQELLLVKLSGHLQAVVPSCGNGSGTIISRTGTGRQIAVDQCGPMWCSA